VQWNGPVLTLAAGVPPRVGPDLLAPGAETHVIALRVRAADPRTPLAVALQDQRLVAGIGNMWAAEALWQHRLSPHLPVGQSDLDTLAELLRWVRSAMLAAVDGDRPARAVYRRVGRPCRRCGVAIRSQGLGEHNRTAYWCPGCQADPRTER
jgi:endonuclease-8